MFLGYIAGGVIFFIASVVSVIVTLLICSGKIKFSSNKILGKFLKYSLHEWIGYFDFFFPKPCDKIVFRSVT